MRFWLTDRNHGVEVGVEVLEAGEAPECVEAAAVWQLVAVLGGEVEPGVPRLDLPRLVAQVGEAVEGVRAQERVDVLDLEVRVVEPAN